MFAVFYDGSFVDWWHNEPSDATWVDRTLAARGWKRELIEVHWYEFPRKGTEILAFDSKKALQVYQTEKKNVEENGKQVEKDVLTVKDSHAARPYFVAGKRV